MNEQSEFTPRKKPKSEAKPQLAHKACLSSLFWLWYLIFCKLVAHTIITNRNVFTQNDRCFNGYLPSGSLSGNSAGTGSALRMK